MQHPDLNYLVQQTIREDRIRTAERERRLPRQAVVSPIRRHTGRALIFIGTRIAARPRPATALPTIGEISLSGRADT